MEVVRKDVSLSEIYGENHNLLAFTLDNVLSAAECEDLIKETEDRGYDLALVNTGGGNQDLRTDVRNSKRCIVDSQEKAGSVVHSHWSRNVEAWL